jgi:EcsC protein family
MAAPEDDAKLRELPSGVWERLRADPSRAPEHLALAAAERHGPAAEEWAAEKRRMYAISPHDLALMAKKRHASLARFSGAATGVGGIVTILPDLAAAAWIQSRCVFFVAAAYGYSPRDPMRPAELLVLQELYDDVGTARAALDGTGKRVVEAMIDSRMSGDEALAARLAKMVGKSAMKRVGARLIPGLAMAFNAIGNERDTRALADRAIAFYGG